MQRLLNKSIAAQAQTVYISCI